MVHARVVRPPSYGARLDARRHRGGRDDARRRSRSCATAASSPSSPSANTRRSRRCARWRRRRSWDERPSLPDQRDDLRLAAAALPPQDMRDPRRRTADRAGRRARCRGDAISRPYQMHGSIGPSCAVALLRGRRADRVDAQPGRLSAARRASPRCSACRPSSVRCIHVEGSGCYGHNGADDVAADAALLARAVARAGRCACSGCASRSMRWEPFGPAMVIEARAALDATATIADWQYEVWSNTHSTRPGGGRQSAAGAAARSSRSRRRRRSRCRSPTAAATATRSRSTRFAERARRASLHRRDAAARVGAARARRVHERVRDRELHGRAGRARRAPIRSSSACAISRTRARARSCSTAAERFGWSGSTKRRQAAAAASPSRATRTSPPTARSPCEVEVDRESGDVRVGRVVAAVDSGEAVNPDGIRNQIEGGIVQSAELDAARGGRLRPTRGSPAATGAAIRSCASRPCRRASKCTSSTGPGQPFLGTGEAAQGPTAAALANAIADATGARLRELPFTAARVRQALGA